MKKYRNNKIAVLLFVLPAMVIFLLFCFLPIVQVFLYSFTKWNGVSEPVFNGLDNYIKLFANKTFFVANKNQLIFAMVNVVYQMLIATVLALVVYNKKTKGRKFLRIAYFIPVVLSVTVVCQLWEAVLSGNGLLNHLFAAFGSSYRQNWLGDKDTAIVVIAFISAWQWMGYQFALINAGIKGIPEEYYEAAQIDGCSQWQAHMKITIPLLKETYRFCLIIAFTGGLKAFSEISILTGGGPGRATYTLTYLMYNAAFSKNQYGYGLSAAAVMVLECMAAMLFINFLFRERNLAKERKVKMDEA